MPLYNALPLNVGWSQWLAVTNRIWQHHGTLLPKWGYKKTEPSFLGTFSVLLACSEGGQRLCCELPCGVAYITRNECVWLTASAWTWKWILPGLRLHSAALADSWTVSHESLWARDTQPSFLTNWNSEITNAYCFQLTNWGGRVTCYTAIDNEYTQCRPGKLMLVCVYSVSKNVNWNF